MDDDKQTIRSWFGLADPFDWRKRSYLGPFLFMMGVLIIGGLFFLAIAAAFKLLSAAVFEAQPQGTGSSFGLTGIIVAMIGAPFVVWRAVVAQKQVNVAEQGQITDRISKAVEGLGIEKEVNWVGRSVTVWTGQPVTRQQTYQIDSDIKLPPRSLEIGRSSGIEHYYNADTDDVEPKACGIFHYKTWPREETRIEGNNNRLILSELEKAVQFGDWTIYRHNKPNLEVRIGAIYALERISKDSPQDHIQIMEILCAYVRNNQAPLGTKTYPDVVTALQVIGRRGRAALKVERIRNYSLNLSKCQFHQITFNDQNFDVADLAETIWIGCNFMDASYAGADMSNARFSECTVENCNFEDADMPCVEFSNSTLLKNTLCKAKLSGAQFLECQLFKNSFVDADFMSSFFDHSNASGDDFRHSAFHNVHLKDTRLFQAKFEGVQIRFPKLEGSSNFEGCNFFGAALQKANLSKYDGDLEDFDGAFLFNCEGTKSEVTDSKEEPDFDSQPDFFQGWRAHQARIGYDPDNPT